MHMKEKYSPFHYKTEHISAYKWTHAILTSWERNGMICAQIAFNLLAISVWKKLK